MVSRFGNDSPRFREASSKMLSTFILTMRGTPYYYNGDELGMTNAGFQKIEDFRDVQTLNEYQHTKNTGGNLQMLMRRVRFESRDNGRTPIQWNGTTNAGFTTGVPWIKVTSNYKTINVAVENADPNSCLNYFKSLVKLRKDNASALVYGKYTLLDKKNPKVYAYIREDGKEKILVLLNFSSSDAQVNINLDISNATLLLSNYKELPQTNKAKSVALKPYQAIVYKLPLNIDP